MERNKDKTNIEVGEDGTQYGEFVSSYFAWIPLPEQKDKAKKMSNMTKEIKINDEE